MKSGKHRFLLILDVVLVVALGLGIFLFQKRIDRQEESAAEAENHGQRINRSISYQGKDYQIKDNLDSVLLIGTDSRQGFGESQLQGKTNPKLADVLVLLVIDHDQKTITPIQLCRETVCQVPWLTESGQTGGTEERQIALAFSSGSGGKDSCRNTRNAVQELLFQAPVDHFLAFDLEAIPLLNDIAGGVTVTLAEDIPDLGPAYKSGESVTLSGDEALRFTRYSGKDQPASSMERFARHRLYIDALLGKLAESNGALMLFSKSAREAIANDPNLSDEGLKGAAKYISTDLSMTQIKDLFDKINKYEIMPTIFPEGDFAADDAGVTFRAEEASLWACVEETFCQTNNLSS